MITFYQRILNSSSLTSGSVWDLLSNPKPTVVQPPDITFDGIIVSDGIEINIEQNDMNIEIQENNIEILVEQPSFEVIVDETPLELAIIE